MRQRASVMFVGANASAGSSIITRGPPSTGLYGSAQARDTTRSALAFREALYSVIAAASSGRRARPADLAIVNQQVAETFDGAALAPAGERFSLETPAQEWLDPVLRPVVRAAVDLLTSDSLSRVRQCADASCAWLFLDTTRSGTRRWCDMRVCGNRNKVRRFRGVSHV